LQLLVNEQTVPIVVNEVSDDQQCQFEAVEFYHQALKDMLHTLKQITDAQKLKAKAKEIEQELESKYADIFKVITAEPMEKMALQNEIKQLLLVDNQSTDDGEAAMRMSQRRAKLMKQYKEMHKHWRKSSVIIRQFQQTLASLKTLVREIILGQVRIQEIRQHILDLHFRKKHAKRMEKLILSDEQLARRQQMYDRIVMPTEQECTDITDEIGSGCYLSTLSLREVAMEGDSLWMCGRVSRAGGVAVSNPELLKIAYISSDLVSDSYFRMALEAAGNDNDDDEKSMDKIGFADSSRQLINARLFPIYGNLSHFNASYPYIKEILSHTLSGRNDIHVVDYNALWTCLAYMICSNDLSTKNVQRIVFEMKPSLKLLSENVKCKPFKANSYAREPDASATHLITLAEKKRTRISKYVQTFRARTTAWVSEVATLFADRLMNTDIAFDQEFYLSAILHRLRIMLNLQSPKHVDDDALKEKVDANHRKLLQILICGDGTDEHEKSGDTKENEEEETNGQTTNTLKFLKGVYVTKILKQKKLLQVPETLELSIDFEKSDQQIADAWNANELKASSKDLLIKLLSRIDVRDLIKGEEFFRTLTELESSGDEVDEEKFCMEFLQQCKYKDLHKVPNDLNVLFAQIGWRLNVNVLRAICCVAILFHRNKAYHDNVEWFGDDVKKQILTDPDAVLKTVYQRYVIKNIRYDYRVMIERQNMEKLRELHTNPILPDDVDEDGNLPYLRCAWSRCGQQFNNRDQLLNHVRYALYGETRPLLHGFHLSCSQVLQSMPSISLEAFKTKVRASFGATKYAQYIRLPMYDAKLEFYYKQNRGRKQGANNKAQQQPAVVSTGNMYYFDELVAVRKH